MQTEPANKQMFDPSFIKKRWPRAAPAWERVERACDEIRRLEALHGTDSPAVIVAREAVKMAKRLYEDAATADERDHLREKSGAIKCECGVIRAIGSGGHRCLSCDRKLS